MKMMMALAATQIPKVLYHGTKKKFTKFSEYRPAFFTPIRAYAEGYGSIIMQVRIDIKHLFDPRHDKRAVEIYNDYFLTSGLARPSARKLKLGDPVPMHDADELWSYLAVPEYPAPHYDGILVYEQMAVSAQHPLKGAEYAFVPLSPDQIHLVK